MITECDVLSARCCHRAGSWFGYRIEVRYPNGETGWVDVDVETGQRLRAALGHPATQQVTVRIEDGVLIPCRLRDHHGWARFGHSGRERQ